MYCIKTDNDGESIHYESPCSFASRSLYMIVPGALLAILTDDFITMIQSQLDASILTCVLVQTCVIILTMYIIYRYIPTYAKHVQSEPVGNFFVHAYFGFQTKYVDNIRRLCDT
jgi:hypothetical protein